MAKTPSGREIHKWSIKHFSVSVVTTLVEALVDTMIDYENRITRLEKTIKEMQETKYE